jgi:2-amino-4-hydroxy-6-hydroxymethyldihydropteridine diphosphokinase
VLPHPGIVTRRFVLEPLVEIRPDLILPGWKTTARELLRRLGGDEPPLVRAGSLTGPKSDGGPLPEPGNR